jgi:hypothetical protein
MLLFVLPKKVSDSKNLSKMCLHHSSCVSYMTYLKYQHVLEIIGKTRDTTSRTELYRDNGLDPYSGGARFEFQSGHLLSCMRVCVVFPLRENARIVT